MSAPQWGWAVYASGMFPPPFIVTVSLKVSSRERFLLICFFPLSLSYFLLGYLCPQFYFFHCISRRYLRAPRWGFYDVLSNASVCLFVYLSFLLGSCHCSLVFQRTPVLRGFSLTLYMHLLPHVSFLTLVMAPFAWSDVAVCSLLDWILLLLLSVSYGSQPWVSALSLSEHAQAKGTRGGKKNSHLTWITILFNTPSKMLLKYFLQPW